MGKKLPTLTSGGIITNPTLLIQRLFDNFLRISSKQSNIYIGKISSYKELVHLYNDDLEEMANKCEEQLNFMYGNYFDEVNIEVGFTNLTDQVYSIVIGGTMISRANNKSYNLNENIQHNNDGYTRN